MSQAVPASHVQTLAPQAGRRVVVTIMAIVAAVGVVIFVVGRTKIESRRGSSSGGVTVGAAPAVKTPTAVRINFSSDPNGAAVIRTHDGVELGRTPLSLQVPYSDSTVQFVLRRPGYEDKIMLIVPNLPAPIFATLRSIERQPSMNSQAGGNRRGSFPQSSRKPAPPPPPATVPASAQPKKPQPTSIDEDAVLEPDFK